jgi:hypothetical protein
LNKDTNDSNIDWKKEYFDRENQILEYLENEIMRWTERVRHLREEDVSRADWAQWHIELSKADHYTNALQNVRMDLYGETLDLDEPPSSPPPKIGIGW